MPQTDSYIMVFIDEAQTQVTPDGFILCCMAYANIYSGPIYVTINPLDNSAAKLSAIKSQVVAKVNADTNNLRNYTTVNCTVFGSFS